MNFTSIRGAGRAAAGYSGPGRRRAAQPNQAQHRPAAAATGLALAVVGLVAGLLVASGLVGNGKPGGPSFQARARRIRLHPASRTCSSTPGDVRQRRGCTRHSRRTKERGDRQGRQGPAAGPPRRQLQQRRRRARRPAVRPGAARQGGTLSFAEIRIGASGTPGTARSCRSAAPRPQVVSMAVDAPGTRLSFITAARTTADRVDRSLAFDTCRPARSSTTGRSPIQVSAQALSSWAAGTTWSLRSAQIRAARGHHQANPPGFLAAGRSRPYPAGGSFPTSPRTAT